MTPGTCPARGLLGRRIVGRADLPARDLRARRRRPRWLGVLAGRRPRDRGASMAFFSTEVGRGAHRPADPDDGVVRPHRHGRAIARFSGWRRRPLLRRRRPQSSRLPLAGLILAGVFFAVFNAALGGDATFKQVFAVVAHSGVVIALQQLFVLPLDYARETMSSPTNLGVFLPFLDENTFRRAPARIDRPLRHLVDREPRDRPRRALQAADRTDRDHDCSWSTARARDRRHPSSRPCLEEPR